MSGPSWEPSAAIWRTDLPVAPCSNDCGRDGTFGFFATEAEASIAEDGTVWCSLACWGSWWHRNSRISGHGRAGQPASAECESWGHATACIAPTGPQGITHPAGDINRLAYYLDEHGLIGVARHRPRIDPVGRRTPGPWTVQVRPDMRHSPTRHGVILMRAAARTWGVDLSRQTFTSEGLGAARRALPNDRNLGGIP